MGRKYISLIVFLLHTAFCFSAVPKWLAYPEKEYPTEKYIRGIGNGGSEASAKKAAMAELSEYFSTIIDSKTYAHSYQAENDLGYTSNSLIEKNITISSYSELFAVHYTQSYYDKKQKQYSICAYIDKEESFNIISQKLSFYKQNLEQKLKLENKETEKFRKIIILNNALAEEKIISTLYEYSMILDSKKSKKFEDFIFLIDDTKNTLFRLKKDNPISVFSEGDFSEEMQAIISKILTENGFIISKYADYTITSNSTFYVIEEKEIFSCSPTVSVFLEGKSGIISSYVLPSENKSSYNRQTVINMAMADVEALLYEKLFQDLL